MPLAPAVPSSPMPPRSILLVKPGSMGDVIHALPVASAIHAAWPDAKLTWIIDPRWQPLLEGNPAVSSAVPFPRQNFRGLKGAVRSVRWYSELHKLAPDLAIDLQGLFRSGLMVKASGAPQSVGLSDSREFASLFYSTIVQTFPHEHAVRRYLRCLPAIGLPVPTQINFMFNRFNNSFSSLLKENYIVIHPFARGAGKSLSQEVINALIANAAISSNIQIVLVGMGQVPENLGPGVLNLVGKTSLSDLVSILREACFVISVDSGPMHLAAGLGVPLLGIHTWSDPRLVGPYDESAWIWQGGGIRRQDFTHAPLPERAFTVEHAKEVAGFVLERMSGKTEK